MNRITPARLQFDARGVPYSAEFDDIYHSTDGGLGQVEHVFMAGNGLPRRWRGEQTFTIVETGFGQGLSFLATWAAWDADPERSQALHFVSVEQFPFTRDDLATLHARYPHLSRYSAELISHWPALTQGVHRVPLAGGRVVLTLLLGDALTLLPQLVARADAIYLDGFAPAKNADMWSQTVYNALWRVSHAGTTLATYTVAGDVRRGLTEAGFAVERIEGFGGKRQMLTGRTARTPRLPEPHRGERHALIIGAGLAGSMTAYALTQSGWRVTLLDADAAPPARSSGNHAGLMHAYYSKDDNLQAQLTRAGCAATHAHLAALTAAGYAVAQEASGILQLAKNDAQDALMATLAAEGNWPSLGYLDQERASARAGCSVARGGWWFADGLTIAPARLVQATLAACGERLTLHPASAVAQLEQANGEWIALNQRGQTLAQAPVAIVASGADLATLLPELPVSGAWRAATVVDASALPQPSCAIAGDGYVTGVIDGARVIGAADFDGDLGTAAAENVARLKDATGLTPERLVTTRACTRPASPDRLPLVGAVPVEPDAGQPVHQLFHIGRRAGLYCVGGLGARGLAYATLAGQLVAAQLNGTPAPLTRKLIDALDPARFVLRRRRSSDQT
ncbi:bifunctional tRNA (5-methylaminomethyl-2-thiouridine)(34)-methyltransferase MnmD/FAD-dependent 5-carboxymethylaminomethyl-2-thiouridine(34) oxidoreductase MnmC [Chitinibacteraceae bacterium HSL-7]